MSVPLLSSVPQDPGRVPSIRDVARAAYLAEQEQLLRDQAEWLERRDEFQRQEALALLLRIRSIGYAVELDPGQVAFEPKSCRPIVNLDGVILRLGPGNHLEVLVSDRRLWRQEQDWRRVWSLERLHELVGEATEWCGVSGCPGGRDCGH